ncbi:MAG: type II toxin-antitoxin system RelE/ParE family toxin [Steroidobacteraceae bacterium]
MIRTFRHRGLEAFFIKDDARKLPAERVGRISRILDRLDAAKIPQDMNLSGWGFHGLKGNRKGTYSVEVSGNWRITFKFDGENALEVDLEDYH